MQSAVRWLTVMLAVAWMAAITGCGSSEEATPGEKTGGNAAASALKDIAKPAPETTAPGQEKAAEIPDMKKVSYCIGIGIGRDLEGKAKMAELTLDAEQIAEGVKAGLGKAEACYTDEQMKNIMMAFQESMMSQQLAKAKKAGEENKVKGDAFLAENGKKEGVKSTASGLQYRVIKTGAGKAPAAADTVTVDYKGRLVDGTPFDSTYDRGEPATFPLARVIPGWSEAIQLMHEGDLWEIAIPSDLAYGESGREGIPPNSVLVFEVELKKVEAAAPAPAPETAPPKTETPKTEAPK